MAFDEYDAEELGNLVCLPNRAAILESRAGRVDDSTGITEAVRCAKLVDVVMGALLVVGVDLMESSGIPMDFRSGR